MRSLGKWELSTFEASLNNGYLATNLSGMVFIRHGTGSIQDMVHFLGISTEKEQAPVWSREPSA